MLTRVIGSVTSYNKKRLYFKISLGEHALNHPEFSKTSNSEVADRRGQSPVIKIFYSVTLVDDGLQGIIEFVVRIIN